MQATANQPSFSIFTPTFNRKHSLHRAYQSLLAQTYKNFDWIIIDDGSTDDTQELVNQWIKEAPFAIQYHWQPNQGKHIAYNHFAKYATGQLFSSIDSDDGVKPNWLERFVYHWNNFTEKEKNEFAGVMCLAENQLGEMIGVPFEKDMMDGDYVEILLGGKIRGDKGGFIQTQIFKDNPYPEDVKNVYLPESYHIHSVSRKWKVRCVNERLIVPWTDDRADHLTHALKKNVNYGGNRYANLAFSKFSMRLFTKHPKTFIANTSAFIKLSALMKKGLKTQWDDIGNIRGRMLWLCCLPIGYILFLNDRIVKK